MDLSAILAQHKEVEFKGVKIQIKQVTLENIPLITQVVSKFFETKGTSKEKIALFLSQDLPAVKKVIESMTNIPAEYIDKLSIDALAFITTEVVKENVDFLQREVAPLLKGMAEVATGLNKSKS